MAGSRSSGSGGSCPQMKITDFRRHQSGALQGFAAVETPSGFTIHGVAIFDQAGSRWCGLPNKPRLSNGKAMKSNAGSWITDPVLEIQDKERKTGFDRAVLAALDRYQETSS